MEREKKECILRAAARAFERFGFKKASVDEIAREAGVAKGTVYLACESKEDLFYQAVHREVRAWVAELARRIDPRKRADELLVEIARSALDVLHERPLVRDLLAGIYEGTLPPWHEKLEPLRVLGRQNLEEILRLGVQQGHFRKDIDVEATARVLQDLQTCSFLQHTRGGEARDLLERRMRAGLDLVLNGLRARPASIRA